MTSLVRGMCSVAAILLLTGVAMGADALTAGKIKGVDADKKQVVVTDANGKDWTFALAENLIVNRGGSESRSDMNAGDAVNILYDKGVLTHTAEYILVQGGESQSWFLAFGKVKQYDDSKGELTITDDSNKDMTMKVAETKFSLNRKPGTVGDIKIGDYVLAVMAKTGTANDVKALYAKRVD